MEECGGGAGRRRGRERFDHLGGNQGSDGEVPCRETGRRGGAGGGGQGRRAARHGGSRRKEPRGARCGAGSGLRRRGREAVAVTESFDALVVGAGPTGLACGIELQQRSVKAVLIEKGCVVNSIY